jgi:heterotetrameric sarcosine oxidase gamma subunit
VGELAVGGALEGLGLPVEAGGCRLAALPAVWRAIVTTPAEGVRFGVGQWLVEGEGEVDVSDAFAELALEGRDAAAVLARLVPVDLDPAAFPAGAAARTLLRHVPLVLVASERGFGLLVPRSYAASAVAEIVVAMRAVAARGEAGDA